MIGVILIVVGITFLAVNQIFYVPKLVAFGKAQVAWVRNHGQGASPSYEAYGLSEASFFISGILGFIAALLMFVGAICIVCFVLILISDRTKGVVTNNETKQNPSQTKIK
jgi:hypothetical protein